MYITGTMDSFMSRLHQLPALYADPTVTGAVFINSGIVSINTFLIEGWSYLASGFIANSGAWEQEARQQRFRLSGDANQLLTQQF